MMTNRSAVLILFVAVIVILLAGCGSDTGPADVYWAYWEACSNGDFIKAEKYLTEAARERSNALGVCGFTHDAINTIEAAAGNSPRGFSEDPELIAEENGATLTWYDDTGNLAMVSLILADGEWKVTDTIWSK
jgi:hypothetical protein